MKINPEYINKLKEFCNTEEEIIEGLHFGFLISLRKQFPLLENYILDGEKSVFPYRKFQIFAINLCKRNVDSYENELVVPLLDEEQDVSEYDTFMRILRDLNIISTGHVNNPLTHSIFTEGARIKFFSVKKRLGDSYDINKLAKIVATYYENSQFAKKLENYLGDDVIQDYKY